MRPTILRKQSSLYDEIKSEVGDPATTGLWGQVPMYTAINQAIDAWAGRVQLPRLYSFAADFEQGVYAYAVPDYIRGEVEVRIRSIPFYANGVEVEDDEGTWVTVPAGFLEPSGTGLGAYFRFHTYPYAQSGQVRYWVDNGRVPTTVPTLDTTIDDNDTSIIVNGVLEVSDVGWWYCAGEYGSYAGVTRGTTDTTLLNCERGLFGSAAAAHDSATAIEWCVAVDDPKLYNQLRFQAIANLHSRLVHRGTAEDRVAHQQATNWAQAEADKFWQRGGYAPQRRPRFVLDQTALGNMPWR